MLERDEQSAARAYEADDKAMTMLKEFPFSIRRASSEDALLRELVVPLGSAGYGVLFKIQDSHTVTVAAVRHQRQDDYH